MQQPTQADLLPIRVVGEVPTIDSLTVADGLGIRHKNLLETIRGHQAKIEESFGVIAFETRKPDNAKGEGRPVGVFLLTEDQALFVGTLSRNSTQVVEFKRVLVESFGKLRRERTEPNTLPAPAAPALPETDQLLLQVLSQQTQLMADNQQLLAQLRVDVDSIMQSAGKPGRVAPPRSVGGRQLTLPNLPAPAPVNSLRQIVSRKVSGYCGFHGATTQDTWNYLYKRMYEAYAINVHRLSRVGKESILDAVERYGHLDRLYSLVVNELDFPDE